MPPIHPNPPTPLRTACGVRQPGIEFEGGDIAPAKVVSSIEECTILCDSRNACRWDSRPMLCALGGERLVVGGACSA